MQSVLLSHCPQQSQNRRSCHLKWVISISHLHHTTNAGMFTGSPDPGTPHTHCVYRKNSSPRTWIGVISQVLVSHYTLCLHSTMVAWQYIARLASTIGFCLLSRIWLIYLGYDLYLIVYRIWFISYIYDMIDILYLGYAWYLLSKICFIYHSI